MTVNLEDRTVACGDVVLPFEVNDYVRWRLMNGYDDIDLTLQHEDDIAAYEGNDLVGVYVRAAQRHARTGECGEFFHR